MSERDLLFLVSTVIVSSTLVLFIWRYMNDRKNDKNE